ncbi:dTDP-4-dehydrorhamnose reductase [Hymenobacter sp. B81]|uniref:dTDP-4-dehydrorhamnose reductase n=1 Tax=Hymenobacter sp. B81 TaxID=3344878 RepID=UPI0037DC9665
MTHLLTYPLPQPVQPLLVTGANGTLGRAFRRICHLRGIEVVALSRADLDIADADQVQAVLRRHRPWAVVNAAGFVRVDEAEAAADRCYRENTTGPSVLAAACAAHGVQLLTFSSDLVFDGRQQQPYVESDRALPLSVYGQSKLLAEQAVLQQFPEALVVRASAFFGPWDQYNFVHQVLTAAQEDRAFEAADDAFVSPTYVPGLVHAALDLLIDEERGIWHVANQGCSSWAQVARTVAEAANFNPDFVLGRPLAALGLPAPRPRQSALQSERAALLPAFEHALRQYLADIGHVAAADKGRLATARPPKTARPAEAA